MQINYRVGGFFEITKAFSLKDVELFAELSGDKNPIHLDNKFAASTKFKKPIVHGMLVSSLFSSIIANKLPGPGSIYIHQSLNFHAPVYHDQDVKARVEITSIRNDKPIFELSTVIKDIHGNVLVDGKAIIMKK